MLHYYFTDKLDLILVQRAPVQGALREALRRGDRHSDDLRRAAWTASSPRWATRLRKEAPLHRLWYDLRAQSLFEEAFRADVAEIDKSLEKMIWRVMSRFAEITGEPVRPAEQRGLCDVRRVVPAGPAQAPVGRQESRGDDAGERAAGRRHSWSVHPCRRNGRDGRCRLS